MASYDDLDTKSIFTVGILSIVVTAVTALAVQVVYYSLEQSQLAKKSAQSSYRRQNAVLEAQEQAISEFGVDELTGKYTIPIQDAIATLVSTAPKADHAGDRSHDSHGEHKDGDEVHHGGSDAKDSDHEEDGKHEDHKEGDHDAKKTKEADETKADKHAGDEDHKEDDKESDSDN